MKLTTEDSQETMVDKLEIHLPFGLIGLPGLERFELSPIKDSPPFLLMRAISNDAFDFIVIDPFGVVPGYELELSNEDAESLQIRSSADVMVLNIITVHSLRPQHVTVNLVGPVVMNRRTLIARQIIAANAEHYSTHHLLIDERNSAAKGAGRRSC